MSRAIGTCLGTAIIATAALLFASLQILARRFSLDCGHLQKRGNPNKILGAGDPGELKRQLADIFRTFGAVLFRLLLHMRTLALLGRIRARTRAKLYATEAPTISYGV